MNWVWGEGDVGIGRHRRRATRLEGIWEIRKRLQVFVIPHVLLLSCVVFCSITFLARPGNGLSYSLREHHLIQGKFSYLTSKWFSSSTTIRTTGMRHM